MGFIALTSLAFALMASAMPLARAEDGDSNSFGSSITLAVTLVAFAIHWLPLVTQIMCALLPAVVRPAVMSESGSGPIASGLEGGTFGAACRSTAAGKRAFARIVEPHQGRVYPEFLIGSTDGLFMTGK